MFRNVMVACLALGLAFGTAFAEDIKAAFVKIDGNKLTVKVDDKEKVMVVGEKTMMKAGKGKEVLATDGLKNYKEGDKLVLKVEKDEVVGVMKEGKKK